MKEWCRPSGGCFMLSLSAIIRHSHQLMGLDPVKWVSSIKIVQILMAYLPRTCFECSIQKFRIDLTFSNYISTYGCTGLWNTPIVLLGFVCYRPVNPVRSCRARSVYLTTFYWACLRPLNGKPVLRTFFHQKLTTALLYFMINLH